MPLSLHPLRKCREGQNLHQGSRIVELDFGLEWKIKNKIRYRDRLAEKLQDWIKEKSQK
jgi:hypothetical protein